MDKNVYVSNPVAMLTLYKNKLPPFKEVELAETMKNTLVNKNIQEIFKALPAAGLNQNLD